MGDTRERAGAAGVASCSESHLRSHFMSAWRFCFSGSERLHISLDYDVFNQQAMSPGEGQEVTVVIKEDASLYKIARDPSESKGLIKSASVFYVQERLSTYHGKLQAWNLSFKHCLYTKPYYGDSGRRCMNRKG